MKPFKLYTIFASLSLMLCTSVFAKTIMMSNDVIALVLPLNQEIRVEFPEMVLELDMPTEVREKVETFLKPDGVLYLKATDLIGKTKRLIVTTAAGDVLLIDVTTASSIPESDKVITIIDPKNISSVRPEPIDPQAHLPAVLKGRYDSSDTDNGTTQTQGQHYSYAEMAAYAMQHYIGPTRLISNLPAKRVKNARPSGRLLRVWSDRVKMTVLNSWLLDEYYITAIQVFNVSNQPLAFDPRAIRGRYLFVATLHDVLQPKGSMQDRTVWVFISSEPFAQAVRR